MVGNLKLILLFSLAVTLNSIFISTGILHQAVLTDDIKQVVFVLKTYSDLIDINEKLNGYTALMAAAYRGNFDITKYLVSHGASLDLQGYKDNTALILALKRQKFDIAKYLINQGANLDIRPCNRSSTMLIDAIMNKYPNDVIHSFINHGANLDIQDDSKETALTWTTFHTYSFDNSEDKFLQENRFFDVAKNLINHGAHIYLKNRDEQAAFDISLSEKTSAFFSNVRNYFEKNVVVIPKTLNKNGELIDPETVPDYLLLAILKNHITDIKHFAQSPQFDGNEYLPNIRHFIKRMQLVNDKNDGLVTMLWVYNKFNPNKKTINMRIELKLQTQENLYTNVKIKNLHDTHFSYQAYE